MLEMGHRLISDLSGFIVSFNEVLFELYFWKYCHADLLKYVSNMIKNMSQTGKFISHEYLKGKESIFA